MKFIVDAQLPKSLSDFLNQKGFDSIHTLDLPDRNKTKDRQIAKLANEEERVVISKDIDFLDSFLVRSEPRKLIAVRTGNIPNRQLISIFEANLDTIIRMISRSNLLEISRTEIAEHGK
jgi:predicted nuclease of predicted toxin-antitoxin system